MTNKSWKTTLGGVLIALGEAIPAVLPPNWAFIGSFVTGIGGLVLGSAARDNNVSSEQAGAK